MMKIEILKTISIRVNPDLIFDFSIISFCIKLPKGLRLLFDFATGAIHLPM